MSFFGSLFKKERKSGESEVDSKQSQEVLYRKGSFIGQKYEVYKELGHGGFGVVYLVCSHRTKAVYALKTFKDEYLEDQATRELFRREANVWVELGCHPYLVRAYLVEEVAGRLYIAMEYVAPNEQDLNSLKGYLDHQPPDLSQSLRWAIQFCHGMEYAYSHGIRCHRDIKPDNVMITTDKTVKITDFGLAGILDASKTASKARLNIRQGKVGLSSSFFEGGGYGTPMYMPPEQFTNAASCDERSDIYSFGMVLYQMASGGSLPFQAPLPIDSSDEERERFWRESYRLHCQALVPRLDSPLFPLIQRCLEKEPNRRYQTFEELRADLGPLLRRQTGEKVKQPELIEFEAWEWLNKGASLKSLGRFDEAIQCYDQALRIDPQYAAAWSNKGNSLASLGRFDEALQCFEQALRITPQLVEAWVSKGASLANLGRFAEAVQCYDQALRINPQYAEAWDNKGNSLGSLGRFDEAIQCHEQALVINPQYPEAWYDKGVSLSGLGRFAEAVRCFDQALRINPQYADAWYNKGNSLGGLGRFDEAIQCFEQALRITPQLVEAWVSKGASLANLGRFAEAAISFRKFIELAPPKYVQQVEEIKQALRELEGR